MLENLSISWLTFLVIYFSRYSMDGSESFFILKPDYNFEYTALEVRQNMVLTRVAL